MIVPESIENLVAFVGYTINSLYKYFFNDTVSVTSTIATDSSDFCGDKLLSFYINDTETSIIQAKNNDFITLSPLKSTTFGVAEAKVIGYMKNHPTIQSSPISFSVTIIDCKVP